MPDFSGPLLEGFCCTFAQASAAGAYDFLCRADGRSIMLLHTAPQHAFRLLVNCSQTLPL